MIETTEDKSSASASLQRAKAKKRWNGKTKNERSVAMSEIAHQRWDGLAHDEHSLRQFFENRPIDEALESYATLRKHYEIAGKCIDIRVQEERSQEKCEHCGKIFDQDTVWYNREAQKDPATGTVRNVFACSQACLIAIKGRGKRSR